MRKIYATTKAHLEAIAAELLAMELGEFGVFIEITTGQRTAKQNNSMHKYFDMLSIALNEAGLDKRAVFDHFRDSVDVPWTPNSTKEDLWFPIMEAQTGKKSTAKLDRKEVSQVYETLTRFLTTRLSVSVPFPCDSPPLI